MQRKVSEARKIVEECKLPWFELQESYGSCLNWDISNGAGIRSMNQCHMPTPEQPPPAAAHVGDARRHREAGNVKQGVSVKCVHLW